jgi:hypothetical protein
MASENGGGGFGWGLLVGGVLGLVAGAYLASGPGREQMESLRQQTIELTGPNSDLRRAVQDGITAARRRRMELEATEGVSGGESVSQGPAKPATES